MSIQRETRASTDVLALILLATNGFLVALMLSLAKVAVSEGMPAITYAFWQSMLAGSMLWALAKLTQAMEKKALATPVTHAELNKSQNQPSRSHLLRYFLISGLSGVALPNVLAFMLVNKLGAGMTAILYALPPLFTLLGSSFLGQERLTRPKLSGILIAVAGCIWIVSLRYPQLDLAPLHWIAWGLVIPLSLAAGNIYRSLDWPDGASPLPLASGMLFGATLLIAGHAMLNGLSLNILHFDNKLITILGIQGLVTAATYLCFFKLQQMTGPLYVSQTGAVAAVFGLVLGNLYFNEAYPMWIWLAVLIVLFGLRQVNKASSNEASLTNEATGNDESAVGNGVLLGSDMTAKRNGAQV